MTCSKCGAENISGSSFCIKCGNDLRLQTPNQIDNTIQMPNLQNQNVSEQSIQPNNLNYTQQINVQQQGEINNIQQSGVNNIQQPTYQTYNQGTNNVASLNYFMYIIAVLLKPFKSFKEEETKLVNTKNSFILSLIISGAATLITIIKTIYSTIRVQTFDWNTFKYTKVWQWSNLKNVKWLEVVGKNFLIYAGIILAIAIIYYLGSLVVKKQISFIKMLSISATAVIPAIISAMILSPLGAKIWAPLSIAFTVIGLIYSILILYELMNDELRLDENIKIYFNLICISILGIAGYYLIMKMFFTAATSGLNNILDLFS